MFGRIKHLGNGLEPHWPLLKESNMATDICTCEISLTNTAALEAWNNVVLEILAHGQGAPVHLGTLLQNAPERLGRFDVGPS